MGTKRRYDGNLIKGLPSFRIINPFVMQGRNESAVFFSHQISMENTLDYIHRFNRDRLGKGKRLTLFHVIICALVRVIALRPQLNRFITGRRIYQRNRIQLSFVVKKQMTEEGRETIAKMSFRPDETLATIMGKVNKGIQDAREEDGNESDREIDFVTKLPRFMLNLVIAGFKFLDYFGIAPTSMLELDPLYASVFLANLGSVGMDAPFHHLYEWGNASIFVAIGKINKTPVVTADGTVGVRDILNINYTIDDRISEGIYFAHALEMFKGFLENPATLLEKPDISPEVLREHGLLEAPDGEER